MKNLLKLFGIIALIAVIGFSFVTCDSGGGGSGGNNFNGGDDGDDGENKELTRYSVLIPTPEQEAELVLRFLYSVSQGVMDPAYLDPWPKHPEINQAVAKVKREEELSPSEEEQVRNYIISIYNADAYQALYSRTYKDLAAMEKKLISTFERYNQAWGFGVPDVLKVILTLYNPNGGTAYTPDYIRWGATESRYENTTWRRGILVHELVHVGTITLWNAVTGFYTDVLDMEWSQESLDYLGVDFKWLLKIRDLLAGYKFDNRLIARFISFYTECLTDLIVVHSDFYTDLVPGFPGGYLYDYQGEVVIDEIFKKNNPKDVLADLPRYVIDFLREEEKRDDAIWKQR